MTRHPKTEAFWNRPVPEDIRRFTSRNLKIVDRVAAALGERGWSQREFARRLGRSEGEVGDWMTGLRDATLMEISRAEAVLGIKLLAVPES